MKKKIFIPLILSLITMFTWQCDYKDDIDKLEEAIDSLHLIINEPEYASTVRLGFIDAKTKKPIIGHKVEVNLKGENAKNLLSKTGSYKPSYDVKLGFIDLVVAPKVVDNLDKNNPMPVDLLIVSNGYIKLTQRILLTGEKLQTQKIMLEKDK